MKTALVTGASSGIGKATVNGLLKAGYTVYAGARRDLNMQSLEAAGARLLPLDVTNDALMTSAVETLLRETRRIDVLVNSAGYGSYGALEDVPMAEARRQCEVNVFGLARLIQLVLPTMREQRFGRIVNVSSSGGKFGGPFGSWYHASKFAVEGLSDSLRMELRQFGINVIIIEPGAIRTEGNGICRASLVKYSGDSAYRDGARATLRMMESAGQSLIASPPEVVARTIVRSVTVRKPRTRYAVGGGAGTLLLLRSVLSDRGFDAILRVTARPPKNQKEQPLR